MTMDLNTKNDVEAIEAFVDKYKELRSRVPTLWTNSYFISTVGGVTLDVVKKYIEDQKNV